MPPNRCCGVDTALVDIVAERFDAGVRFGDSIAKDMIAVRIGPDIRFVMVASPAYFEKHGRPRTPNDLAHHQCINMRLPTLGGIYAWELEKDGRETRVRVDGRLVFNSVPMVIQAAVDGFGIAYCQLDRVADLIAEGKLEWILDDWCPPFPGYHLYYPSRRQQSPAFALIVQALRYPRAGRAE
jgi:DNA-binding transcriptional LysR family regulator